MALLISGTVVVDETTGSQTAGNGESDSSGNDTGVGNIPTEFGFALSTLGVVVGDSLSAAVSGATAGNATGSAMITGLPAEMTNLSWSDSGGAPLDGVDSGLTTTDGTMIFLYTYSGDDNVLLGRLGTAGGLADPTGAIAFAAYLDTMTADPGDAGATEAKVWMVQFETMFNLDDEDPDDPVSPLDVIYVAVSEVATFDLSGAPSGQNLFLMYGDPDDGDAGNGDEVALIVTASNATTGGSVCTSQGGGGTTIGNANQMIDPGEGVTFTFVTNANPDYTVPNLDQNEADDAANFQFDDVHSATSAFFTVVQTQPASKSSTLTIKAYDTIANGDDVETGANFIGGYADDELVEITSVVVTNAAGDPVSLSVTYNADGTATVVGLKAGYMVQYTTAEDHQRVEIDNSGTKNTKTGAAFDVGGFSLVNTVVEPTLFSAMAFEDDGPSLAFGNLVGTGSEETQIGYWDMAAGADGLGSFDIVLNGFSIDDWATTLTSFTFGLDSVDGDGNYLYSGTLTADFNNDGDATDEIGFTFTAFVTDGHYELDLTTGFGSSIEIDTADGALAAGGPDAVQTLIVPKPPAAPITDVVFFSAKVSATYEQIETVVREGEPDYTEAEIQTTANLFQYVDSARGMNVSTSGIGVANNLLEGDATAGIGGTDESFVINPEILVNSMRIFVDNSVQGYAYSKGEELYYTIYYSNGDIDEENLVTTDLGITVKGQPDSFLVEATGGREIDAVQLTMGKGDVKIPHIVFGTATESLASDIKIDFTATVTDGDGDEASSDFVTDLFTNDLGQTFDYVLAGTAAAADAFNIDLSSDLDSYQVTGFDATTDLRDVLVLIGDAGATVQSIVLVNSDADSEVTILETGGGTTTVTVVGVTDLTGTDIVFPPV